MEDEEELNMKNIEEFDSEDFHIDESIFGVLLQLPGKNGHFWDPTQVIEKIHQANILVTVAIDPLAQVLLEPVGHLGVDIAVGSSQRFGVPIGFGGPHAAFFATKEIYKRQVPGRLVGESLDADEQDDCRTSSSTSSADTPDDDQLDNLEDLQQQDTSQTERLLKHAPCRLRNCSD